MLTKVFVQARKFLVALSAAVEIAIADSLIPAHYQHPVTAIIAVANAILVYYVPNGSVSPTPNTSAEWDAIISQSQSQTFPVPPSSSPATPSP